MLSLVRSFSQTVKNEGIKHSRILLIGEKGENLGDALAAKVLSSMDRSKFDLVLVNDKSTVPVCKIISKQVLQEKVERDKQQKDIARVASKEKEMYIGSAVSEHDLGIKISKIHQFMEKGFRTKVVIEPKGHNSFMGESLQQLQCKIVSQFESTAQVEKASSGNSSIVLKLIPNKPKLK